MTDPKRAGVFVLDRDYALAPTHPGVSLPEVNFDRIPTRIRFSRVIADIRARAPDLVPGLVELQRTIGSNCPVHGPLPDPVIALVSGDHWPEDSRVAFVCPDCSDPAIREAWEREGPAPPEP